MAVWAVALSSTDLSIGGLSPVLYFVGIQSLIWFGKILLPLAISVLYPRQRTYETLPR